MNDGEEIVWSIFGYDVRGLLEFDIENSSCFAKVKFHVWKRKQNWLNNPASEKFDPSQSKRSLSNGILPTYS